MEKRNLILIDPLKHTLKTLLALIVCWLSEEWIIISLSNFKYHAVKNISHRGLFDSNVTVQFPWLYEHG